MSIPIIFLLPALYKSSPTKPVPAPTSRIGVSVFLACLLKKLQIFVGER